MRWVAVVTLLFAFACPVARAEHEDPECRGRCASEYQSCTAGCRTPPGEPFDSRKVAQCGDRCLKQSRDCNRACAGKK
jgi:hypothetical protein